MQLLVSLVTAYINFYKWDKKYFVYMIYKQRIEQEVWTYLELTGKYGIVNPFNPDEVECMETTHRSKIKRFLFQLETIFRKLKDTDFGIENTDADANAERIVSSNHEHEAKQRSSAVDAKINKIKKQLRELIEEGAEAEDLLSQTDATQPLEEHEWVAVEREREARQQRRIELEHELERYQALKLRNNEIDSQIQAMHSTVQIDKPPSTSVNVQQATPTLLFKEPESIEMSTLHSTPRRAIRHMNSSRQVSPVSTPTINRQEEIIITPLSNSAVDNDSQHQIT